MMTLTDQHAPRRHLGTVVHATATVDRADLYTKLCMSFHLFYRKSMLSAHNDIYRLSSTDILKNFVT